MKIKHISQFKDNIDEKLFGLTPESDVIYAYELTNKNGYQLHVMNYGATITSLKIPLKNGEMLDVVSGFCSLEDYLRSFNLESAPYFGATIGRFAGRIKNGIFKLNNTAFQLNKNKNNHSLHGGKIGFSQKVWEFKNSNSGKNPSVTLTCFSPHGDENFPGDLTVEVTYTLSDENELIVEYSARTTEDTIVNLTHHSYFNLEGHDSSIVEQELFINSRKTLETTSENIPTGSFLNLANCPFDFNVPKKCPLKIDNTFVLDKETHLAASLYSKKNNLKMEVFTNQPAVHIYVGGNCFDKIKGKGNANYHAQSGICFETQNFPDAPNHEHFPSSELQKESTYYHKTTYKFQLF